MAGCNQHEIAVVQDKVHLKAEPHLDGLLGILDTVIMEAAKHDELVLVGSHSVA